MHRIIGRFSGYWPAVSIRSIAPRAIFRVAGRMAARPQLYAFAKQLVARFPFLDRRLRAIVRTEGLDAQTRAERIYVADLTPHGHRVYLELLEAIKNLH